MAETPAPGSTLCILVGAGTFATDHPFGDLSGRKAEHGVDAMAEVFRGAEILKRVDPRTPHEIESLLEKRRRPPELLVFYYVGHGYLDPEDQDELYLAMAGSDAGRIATTALSVRHLLERLDTFGAGETVLILDCCYSGNVSKLPFPLSRPFGTLTSSRVGRVISPGSDKQPMTCFTSTLVATLREEHRTLYDLGLRMTEQSARPENQPDPGHPWFPVEQSASGGAGIVLPTRSDPSPAEEGTGLPPAEDPWWEGSAKRAARWLVALPGRLRRRWLPSLVGALLLGGAAFALIALLSPEPGSACPPPLELRLVTAPEEVDPVRELVHAFEESEGNEHTASGADNCPVAGFTVYGSGLDALAEAFHSSQEWGRGASLAKVGPQPDAWISQSSAAVSRVRSELVPPEKQRFYEFFQFGSLMRDEPTLVLTGSARERLALPPTPEEPGEITWKELRTGLDELADDERPALLRPNPTISGVGLAHTFGMYSAAGGDAFEGDSGVLPVERINWLENEVISRGRSVAESSQALCALTDPDGPDLATGALVSRRQANLYEANPNRYCSAASEPDVHRYRVTGGPPLDYQLVQIAWPADDRKLRKDALDRFHDWARSEQGEAAVEDLGYRAATGEIVPISDKDVSDRLALFREAHPELRLTVLFDVNGSMREQGRFEAAREAVEASLNRLGESDEYRLAVFPTGGGGTGTERRVEWSQVPESGFELPLRKSEVLGRDQRQADLHSALQEISGSVESASGGRQHAVLLVTDGDYLKGEPESDRLDKLEEVADEFGRRDVPVIVASMRSYGCSGEKDTGTIAEESGGECERFPGDLASELSKDVAALTEGRRQT